MNFLISLQPQALCLHLIEFYATDKINSLTLLDRLIYCTITAPDPVVTQNVSDARVNCNVPPKDGLAKKRNWALNCTAKQEF